MCTGPSLTAVLHVFEPLGVHLEGVDVFPDHASPPLKALHHAPRLGEISHYHHHRVAEGVSLEDKRE